MGGGGSIHRQRWGGGYVFFEFMGGFCAVDHRNLVGISFAMNHEISLEGFSYAVLFCSDRGFNFGF